MCIHFNNYANVRWNVYISAFDFSILTPKQYKSLRDCELDALLYNFTNNYAIIKYKKNTHTQTIINRRVKIIRCTFLFYTSREFYLCASMVLCMSKMRIIFLFSIYNFLYILERSFF